MELEKQNKKTKPDCGPNMMETRSTSKADTVPVSDVRVVLKLENHFTDSHGMSPNLC